MSNIKLTPYSSITGQRYEHPARFVLENNDFKNVPFQDGKVTCSIANCDFTQLDIENTEEIDFRNVSISFTGCYIRDLTVVGIEAKNINLLFNSCIVAGKIQNANLASVSVNNCILSRNLFFINLKQVLVSFTEENIFFLRWKNLFERIGVEDPKSFLTEEQRYHVHECTELNFSSNFKDTSKPGLYWAHGNGEYRIGLRLSPQQKALINLHLSIKHESAVSDKSMKINNVVLNALELSGNFEGKLLVENSKIANWFMIDFKPKLEATFYNISTPATQKLVSKIEFHKSNLDNAWFDNIDFKEYSLVSFYRTKFSKTIFTSCNFPKSSPTFIKFTSLKNVHYPDKKEDNYYKDQYEVYLQLKMALEANGNFQEAQKLYAISNDALRKIEDVSRWDKLILNINKCSNEHGLSIIKPFRWFIVFSITFYILYLLSLDRLFNGNDLDWTLFGYYFSFIDPTHRTDFLVEKEEFTALSLVLDYLNKIFVAFFVYQFIAAFRKYGKH